MALSSYIYCSPRQNSLLVNFFNNKLNDFFPKASIKNNNFLAPIFSPIFSPLFYSSILSSIFVFAQAFAIPSTNDKLFK